jgi:hypothetical protein
LPKCQKSWTTAVLEKARDLPSFVTKPARA